MLHVGDFDEVTKGLQTKSDKIRELARHGAATADIARYLGIRYQHARNVLIDSGLHRSKSEQEMEAVPVADALEPAGNFAWTVVDSAGRLQIPRNLMKEAGIDGNEPVHVRVSDGAIEVLSRRAALRRAHKIARQFVPEGISLVEELIAERRREAGLRK